MYFLLLILDKPQKRPTVGCLCGQYIISSLLIVDQSKVPSARLFLFMLNQFNGAYVNFMQTFNLFEFVFAITAAQIIAKNTAFAMHLMHLFTAYYVCWRNYLVFAVFKCCFAKELYYCFGLFAIRLESTCNSSMHLAEFQCWRHINAPPVYYKGKTSFRPPISNMFAPSSSRYKYKPTKSSAKVNRIKCDCRLPFGKLSE